MQEKARLEHYGLELMARGFAEKEAKLFSEIAEAQRRCEEMRKRCDTASAEVKRQEGKIRALQMENGRLKKRLSSVTEIN